MPKEKQHKVPEKLRKPHHIFPECEKHHVGSMRVHDIHGNEISEFEPIVKVETIRKWLMANHPAGEYSLVPFDLQARRMPGSKVIKVEAVEVATQTTAEAQPNEYYIQKQLEDLQREKEEIAKIRRKLGDKQDALAIEQQNLQSKTYTEHTQMLLGFLKSEKEAEAARREKEEALRRDHEERMRKMEQSFTERVKKLETDFESKKGRLEEERLRMQEMFEQKQSQLNQQALEMVRLDSERRLEEMSRLHELELQQTRTQLEAQMTMQQKLVELKLAEQEADLKKKYKPDIMSHLPSRVKKDISERAVERIIDQEYPEKTKIDRVMEQVTSVLSHIDEKMPNLATVIGQAAMKAQKSNSLRPAINPAIPQSTGESFDLDEIEIENEKTLDTELELVDLDELGPSEESEASEIG